MTRILVFSQTTGYRHDSIPAGTAALRALDGVAADATEDPAVFTPDALAPYAVVVFLNTSGDLLTPAQRAAFEAHITAGGGYVGVHAAANTGYDWPFYGDLVGAWFDRHPDIQPATVVVEDRDHPATAHLDPLWTVTDEWYDFRTNPRPTVRVLATVREATYTGGAMGEDHPITWCREHAGGRSFYTALGHTVEAYADPAFLTLLGGAIRWAAGTA